MGLSQDQKYAIAQTVMDQDYSELKDLICKLYQHNEASEDIRERIEAMTGGECFATAVIGQLARHALVQILSAYIDGDPLDTPDPID